MYNLENLFLTMVLRKGITTGTLSEMQLYITVLNMTVTSYSGTVNSYK